MKVYIVLAFLSLVRADSFSKKNQTNVGAAAQTGPSSVNGVPNFLGAPFVGQHNLLRTPNSLQAGIQLTNSAFQDDGSTNNVLRGARPSLDFLAHRLHGSDILSRQLDDQKQIIFAPGPGAQGSVPLPGPVPLSGPQQGVSSGSGDDGGTSSPSTGNKVNILPPAVGHLNGILRPDFSNRVPQIPSVTPGDFSRDKKSFSTSQDDGLSLEEVGQAIISGRGRNVRAPFPNQGNQVLFTNPGQNVINSQSSFNVVHSNDDGNVDVKSHQLPNQIPNRPTRYFPAGPVGHLGSVGPLTPRGPLVNSAPVIGRRQRVRPAFRPRYSKPARYAPKASYYHSDDSYLSGGLYQSPLVGHRRFSGPSLRYSDLHSLPLASFDPFSGLNDDLSALHIDLPLLW